MNPAIIRNLLFDLGNVIVDIDVPGAHQRLNALLRKDTNAEIVEKAFLSYECGKMSTDIFINTILSQCERKAQALDVIEAWNSMLIGIPSYRLDMLEMLRRKYNVYVVSNTNELHLEWIHRYVSKTYHESQFEKRYFDQAFYSHLVGDRKPNPSLYTYIAEETFLTPELTLFMDDTMENIESAHALGFQTYFVKPGEEIAEFLKIEGFY